MRSPSPTRLGFRAGRGVVLDRAAWRLWISRWVGEGTPSWTPSRCAQGKDAQTRSHSAPLPWRSPGSGGGGLGGANALACAGPQPPPATRSPSPPSVGRRPSAPLQPWASGVLTIHLPSPLRSVLLPFSSRLRGLQAPLQITPSPPTPSRTHFPRARHGYIATHSRARVQVKVTLPSTSNGFSTFSGAGCSCRAGERWNFSGDGLVFSIPSNQPPILHPRKGCGHEPV